MCLGDKLEVLIVIAILLVSGLWLGNIYFSTEKESCKDQWPKLPNLKKDLAERVYGQPLAIDIVQRAINAHFRHPPEKALVLSFQGLTGTGKNLVASIIAEELYKDGLESKYVRVFTPHIHFGDPSRSSSYKEQLREWVKGNVTECGRQLFIFDEVHHMPQGVMDTLTSFLDYYDTVEGVDYKNSIYILLSNNGGEMLMNKLDEDYYQKGKNREDFKLDDNEQTLLYSAFQEKGGLKDSILIKSGAISHYVPFLPLEEEHVRNCIHYELKRDYNIISHGKIEKLVDEVMGYIPMTGVFSKTGCKSVPHKVGLLLENYRNNKAEL